MTDLHFAQISDVHISVLGDQYDMLSGRSAGFLADLVFELNQIDDLDFVLFSGDLLVTGQRQELDQFLEAVWFLEKPYYVIPGNHDYTPTDGDEGLTRQEFMRHVNPQFQDRSSAPGSQPGYWSLTVKPGIQLIGLDSNRDEDWGGVITAPQMAWLKNELAAHVDKLIVLAVHHPLHALAPIDQVPDWSNFVLKNGPELLTLLDSQPQVKVVLTGHHHLTKADTLGRRIHLACPALAIYPCAYRTLRFDQHSGDQWWVEWQTHQATDEANLADAHTRMLEGWIEVGFERDFVEAYVRQAWGREEDRRGRVVL
jgi:3',5'-cyclic AMP phosphodiesterase CpdA